MKEVIKQDQSAEEMASDWDKEFSHIYRHWRGEAVPHDATALCGKLRGGVPLFKAPTRQSCPICLALANADPL